MYSIVIKGEDKMSKEMSKGTTIWMDTETATILRELSAKSRISLSDFFKEFAREVKRVMDMHKDVERFSVGSFAHPDNKPVVLTVIAPMYVGEFLEKAGMSDADVDKAVHEDLGKKVKKDE